MASWNDLKEIHNSAYKLLGKGKDVLFELMDAVLSSRGVSSFAEFSLSPLFRRKWSSLHKTLRRNQASSSSKRIELYREQLPRDRRILLAGDNTAWSRLWSSTLRDRTYEHQLQRGPGSRPVTLGQGYCSLVCVPEEQGSWVLPLLHEHISSFETPWEKAVMQLKQVCQQLNERSISLWDSAFGYASFVLRTPEIPCDKLMRIKSNRVVYGPPPEYGGRGRPRKHGKKFKLNEPSTWWEPQDQREFHDERLGLMRLRRWENVHFQKAASQPMQLMLLERLDRQGKRKQKALWLVGTGETLPRLEDMAQIYLRRFCIEHWYRFIKQRLNWCLPHLGTESQTQVWSTLMPLMTWQLWLGRHLGDEVLLPWQKPSLDRTSGRVVNGFSTLLLALGSPTTIVQPRGNSTGWPKGKKRQKRKRYPTVKKSYVRPKPRGNFPI